MTATFQIFSMLCGLGSAVFAASQPEGGSRTWHWLALALGFSLAALWARAGRSLDPASVAGLVIAVGTWHLVNRGSELLALALAGTLAAVWASLLQVEGIPRLPAFAVAALVPIASAHWSQRTPAFAPPIIRDEATLGILGLALIVAMAPTVSQGWQAALVLNLEDKSALPPILPHWLVGGIAGSVTLGGLWSLWRRG